MNQLEKWNSDGAIALKSTEDVWGETPSGSQFRAKTPESAATSIFRARAWDPDVHRYCQAGLPGKPRSLAVQLQIGI